MKKIKNVYWILLAAGLVACGGKKEKEAAQAKVAPPAMAVSVTTVSEQQVSYYDQYPATVAALNQVDIRPQVTGYITGIYFQDGQHVDKGQKLYSIDDQQYRANYNQAIANVNVQKANLEKAQKDADRYNELLRQDAVAKQQVDYANAGLKTAQQQLVAAQANVASVETNLKYSTITSPLTGTIGISLVKMGAAVSPGQTLLNTVSGDDPMAVDVAVDQKLIPRILQLQQTSGSGSDSTFTLVLPDGSISSQMGHIQLIDRAVDPQTGTIRIRLVFANPGHLLKAGMSCNVRIRNNNPAGSLLIPYKAVTEQMGEYFVFLLMDPAADSTKVLQKKISLGSRINDKVIVQDGLKSGDKIVLEGGQRLKDSSLIKIAGPHK